MTKSVFAAGLAAALLAASAASAQAPIQAQTPAADAARLTLARQIFEAQGGAQSATNIAKTFEKTMADSITDPAAKQRMEAIMDGAIKSLMPRLFDNMAQFYAIDFNEAQLKDILAFYQSPTGQALREKQPVLAAQIGTTMAQLMPKMQLSVMEKVCSQIECTDQQKQILARLEQAIPADKRF